MRQKNREITDFNEKIEVMKKCDVCRLALNDDGYPYIIPLNFGMSVEGKKVTLYFHSALEGYKVDLMKRDNRASFEMDCNHLLQYFEDKGMKRASSRCNLASGTLNGQSVDPVMAIASGLYKTMAAEE